MLLWLGSPTNCDLKSPLFPFIYFSVFASPPSPVAACHKNVVPQKPLTGIIFKMRQEEEWHTHWTHCSRAFSSIEQKIKAAEKKIYWLVNSKVKSSSWDSVPKYIVELSTSVCVCVYILPHQKVIHIEILKFLYCNTGVLPQFCLCCLFYNLLW